MTRRPGRRWHAAAARAVAAARDEALVVEAGPRAEAACAIDLRFIHTKYIHRDIYGEGMADAIQLRTRISRGIDLRLVLWGSHIFVAFVTVDDLTDTTPSYSTQ